VLLGSQSLLKDFETNLVGLKKDESKTFKIVFPADYGKKELADKEAEFTVKLHEIKAKKLPVVDNDFAKDAGKAESVKELREKLEAQIKANKELEQRSKMIEQIGEKLISSHGFDIPVSLINQEQQRLVRQAVQNMRGQGMEPNQLPEEQRKKLFDDLRPIAQKNVHMALIVEKITVGEGIKAIDKDVDAYIEKTAGNINQPPDVLRRYLLQQGNLDGIKDWIQYEKTLDFLIAEAKIESV
jgi:trigger factor